MKRFSNKSTLFVQAPTVPQRPKISLFNRKYLPYISISPCSALAFSYLSFFPVLGRDHWTTVWGTRKRGTTKEIGVEKGWKLGNDGRKLAKSSPVALCTTCGSVDDAVTTRLRRDRPDRLTRQTDKEGKEKNNRHDSADDSKRFQTTRPPRERRRCTRADGCGCCKPATE